MSSLRLDWCSHTAAKYAVIHWHYSKRMPIGAMVKIGVWEDEQFIGCVLFARGNSPTLGTSYGCTQTEVCELVRVALRDHITPVSRILAIAVKMLRAHCPGLRLLVSFADPAHGHHGGIYQASNWIFCGHSQPECEFFHEGRWKHRREVTAGAFGKSSKVADRGRGLIKRPTLPKCRYLLPLDEPMRERIVPLAQPYPKRVGSDTNDTAAVQVAEGGVTPTSTLHKSHARTK